MHRRPNAGVIYEIGSNLAAPGALPATSDGNATGHTWPGDSGCGRRANGLVLRAAQPIGEPVVRYGPLVMTTQDEIRQAIDDVRSGALTNSPRLRTTHAR